MVSRTCEYALRAAVWLAQKPDAPQTTRQIAEVTQVSVGYLAKILKALSRAGVVKGQRGLHGGYLLARRADRISMLEIVNAVDPIPRIHKCPLELPSHRFQLCPLHRRLDQAYALVERMFSQTSLNELITPGLCPLQETPAPDSAREVSEEENRPPPDEETRVDRHWAD